MNQGQTIRKNSRAAVVGFGKSGQAMARYLARCGAHVMVSDARTWSELSLDERELLGDLSVEFEGGGHTGPFLCRAETIVVSPGVDTNHPALAEAVGRGSEILGELALGAHSFRAPVVAITGTNGKTTVTELIGALLKEAGKNVFVGGNIGTPIGEYLLAPEGYDAVVLEVSSFQLDLSGEFTPEVGVLLNITPDHLDRHATLERYAGAKMKIFQGGSKTTAVINGDDPLCRQYLKEAAGIPYLQFGHSPRFDAWINGSVVTLSRGGGKYPFDLKGSNLDNFSGTLNSAAALLAVQKFDIAGQTLLQGLRTFQTGPHRLQVVAEKKGVTFIDDSKATNTGAVINALLQVGNNVILIAGGKDKGDDYRLLREVVKKNVKHLILIGEASRKIGEAVGDLVPHDYLPTLEDAVRYGAVLAEPGDTVLLSPACASFDMFSSYAHRGECFADAVHGLDHDNDKVMP